MGSLGAATQSSTKQSWIRLAVLCGDCWNSAVVAQLFRKPQSSEVCVAPLAKVSMSGLVGSQRSSSQISADIVCLANCGVSLAYATKFKIIFKAFQSSCNCQMAKSEGVRHANSPLWRGIGGGEVPRWSLALCQMEEDKVSTGSGVEEKCWVLRWEGGGQAEAIGDGDSPGI